MSIYKVLSITLIFLTSNVSIAALETSSQKDLLNDKKLYSSDKEAILLAEKNQALKLKNKDYLEGKETANLESSKEISIFEYRAQSEYKALSKDDSKSAENNTSIKDYVFNDKSKEEFFDKDFAIKIITGDKIDTKTFDGDKLSAVLPQIPEPETYMMFLGGLMLLALTHKKIKKNSSN